MQLYGSHILLFRLEVHSMASMPSANNLVVIAKDASYTAVVECTYAVVCGHLSCAVLLFRSGGLPVVSRGYLHGISSLPSTVVQLHGCSSYLIVCPAVSRREIYFIEIDFTIYTPSLHTSAYRYVCTDVLPVTLACLHACTHCHASSGCLRDTDVYDDV